MSAGDDWQVGDLALLVSGREGESRPDCNSKGQSFALGGIYTVERVVFHRQKCGLVIEGFRSDHSTGAFLASSFRKIRPLTDDEHLLTIVELAADKIIHAPAEV